jgi:hypothetical protein
VFFIFFGSCSTLIYVPIDWMFRYNYDTGRTSAKGAFEQEALAPW